MARTLETRLPRGAADYPVEEGILDEAFVAPGEPRPLYRPVLEALAAQDLAATDAAVRRHIDAAGLDFGEAGFPVDAVPGSLPRRSGPALEAGLTQRLRALNAFVSDAYGDQLAIADGVLPERLVTTCDAFEPAMRGLLSDGAPPIGLVGFDIVRSADGELLVLEDNLRMPSGLTYATTIRDAVSAALEWPLEPRPLDSIRRPASAACLRAAAPTGDGEGIVRPALRGTRQRRLVRAPAAVGSISASRSSRPATSRPPRGRLHARTGSRRAQIDVLYRRVDDERLTRPDGSPTELGELLLPALRAGRLRCVNSFGTGIGDDKLTHAYVERMIHFYLGEEPLLRSVPAYDLLDPDDGEGAMDRLEELVLKPRGGFGGQGVVLVPRATESVRREATAPGRRRPRRLRRPGDGRALDPSDDLRRGPAPAPRRPATVRRHRRRDDAVVPGGLTRYAVGAGEMVVNSSRGGGGKDTGWWRHEDQVACLPGTTGR